MEKEETARDNRLEDEAIARDIEQLRKENDRYDRELALKEAAAGLDNQLTQERLNQLKEGKTSDATGVVEDVDYSVYFSAAKKQLKADGAPKELIDALYDYDEWVSTKRSGSDTEAAAFASYKKYLAAYRQTVNEWLEKEGNQ